MLVMNQIFAKAYLRMASNGDDIVDPLLLENAVQLNHEHHVGELGLGVRRPCTVMFLTIDILEVDAA